MARPGESDGNPNPYRARDLDTLRRIVAAREGLEAARAELAAAVAAAREAGNNWTVIAAALDTTPKAAWQKWNSRHLAKVEQKQRQTTATGAVGEA